MRTGTVMRVVYPGNTNLPGVYMRARGSFEGFLFFLEQAVADAADGVDHPGEVAELFADGGDMNVDGAVGDEHVGAHRLVHELIAREHPAAGGEDGGEEFEFGGGEIDAAALDGDFVLALVDDYGAGGEEGHGGFHGGFAAKDGADAGQEDFHGEGFGDVVIRAEGEADDYVGFFGLGGEHDDGEGGGVGIGFEGAGDVLAGEARHHDVEDDEVGALFAGDVEAGGAIVGADDVEAVALEIDGDEFDEVAFIIDDEDFFAACHGSPLGPGSGRKSIVLTVGSVPVRVKTIGRVGVEFCATLAQYLQNTAITTVQARRWTMATRWATLVKPQRR